MVEYDEVPRWCLKLIYGKSQRVTHSTGALVRLLGEPVQHACCLYYRTDLFYICRCFASFLFPSGCVLFNPDSALLSPLFKWKIKNKGRDCLCISFIAPLFTDYWALYIGKSWCFSSNKNGCIRLASCIGVNNRRRNSVWNEFEKCYDFGPSLKTESTKLKENLFFKTFTFILLFH